MTQTVPTCGLIEILYMPLRKEGVHGITYVQKKTELASTVLAHLRGFSPPLTWSTGSEELLNCLSLAVRPHSLGTEIFLLEL